jgi:hypothetical protein
MGDFPEAAAVDSLEPSWSLSAIGIYRNWLNYLVSRRSASARSSAVHAAQR